ncbi:hypothetical protein BH20ACT2_BH20ACT2_14110 [soil metagenome]
MPHASRSLLRALTAATAALLVVVGGPLAATPAAAATRATGDHEQIVDLTFPTDRRATYTDDYLSPRSRGHHGATDLLGEKGWPVHAAVGGEVTSIPGADGSAMPSYGYMVSIAGDDGREYHYIHLNNDTPGTDDGQGGPQGAYAAGLRQGSQVARGQLIGWVGDSGNAEGTTPHLHFAIDDPAVIDPQGTNRINPFNSLNAARARGDYAGDAPVAVASSEQACPAGRVPVAGFDDVALGEPHAAAIDCATWWEIAQGLDSSSYGPGRSVTREQMATFVRRLLGAAAVSLPAGADRFHDDDSSEHAEAINALAAAGLVSGDADGHYRPKDPVNRAQMATFLVRAYEHAAATTLPAGQNAFADDDGDDQVHSANIDKAAAAGFVSGYPDGSYRPSSSVTRAQMASFLTRVLDTLVEDGRATLPS